MSLAHLALVGNGSEDVLELIEHFDALPDEDRARILALVRSLSICRTAELYSTRPRYEYPVPGAGPSAHGAARARSRRD